MDKIGQEGEREKIGPSGAQISTTGPIRASLSLSLGERRESGLYRATGEHERPSGTGLLAFT